MVILLLLGKLDFCSALDSGVIYIFSVCHLTPNEQGPYRFATPFIFPPPHVITRGSGAAIYLYSTVILIWRTAYFD